MDNQNKTIISEEEKEQKASEYFRKTFDYMLESNEEILVSIAKLKVQTQANSEELERKLIDTRIFRDILYKAFGVFTVVQLATALLFAWVLLNVLK